VVVPTYGRPGPLRRCVEALARLDYPADRLEVLVVDDASPEPVGAGDVDFPGTLRVIRVRNNRGPAAARNRGAGEATGRILLFTDDDCRPDPGWARAFARVLEEEPDALVGGDTLNGLDQNLFAQASQDLISYLYVAFARSRRLQPFFTSNNVAMRRDRFLDVGGFDESFRLSAGEDRDLCERWGADVGPLRFVGDARIRHYHDLTLGRFVRQHFRYGRGAVHLARLRSARGQARPRPEPLSFYARMLAHPTEGRPAGRGVKLSVLVALSQLCSVAGMAAEAVHPHNDPT
jgi:GT2 family glycosyltransferase